MQGKRRLHQKPKALEIRACKPWRLAEIEPVRPEVILALGATAAGALFGSGVSVAGGSGVTNAVRGTGGRSGTRSLSR